MTKTRFYLALFMLLLPAFYTESAAYFILGGTYFLSPPPPQLQANIHIDQFGYLPQGIKIAVISNPINGYNNGQTYTPSTTFRVKRVSDDQTVFVGNISTWNSGNTHSQSGDRAWWFDFSTLSTEGEYYLFDSLQNKSSYPFAINTCVYSDAMAQAFKTFYYQRCGSVKTSTYVPTGYADASCHIGGLQDTHCRLYSAPSNAANELDLHGGWHDAGDYNKYVNFTYGTLIDLLLAYAENPDVWTDDFSLPESGNGLPDLLDEVKFELDWLRRMQRPNGSVLSVVGVQNYASASPPSTDVAQRLYGPATTSAAYSAAAVFALSALQYESAGMTAYADTLETAAVNAYNWAVANPNVTFYNSGTIAAGEQEVDSYESNARQLGAAVFLYARTNTAAYKTYVESNYTNIHLLQWSFAYVYEHTHQDVLLYYAALSGASTAVRNAIQNAYAGSMQNSGDNLPAYLNQTDAYRAFLTDNNHTWGSNQLKATMGSMYQAMNFYNLNAANATNYQRASTGYLHYLHGVNPNNLCYLTNMGAWNVENSVREIYHGWFTDGSTLWDRVGTSTYGPASGFMPGGPTYQYALDACCSGSCSSDPLCNTAAVTPPLGQPVLKAYKEFNTGWPQNSWVVSETAIYTQAVYLRLLSKFACVNCTLSPAISGENATCPNTLKTYTTDAIAGATYLWTVNGGTIQLGQGTNSIQVLWQSGTTGTVEVMVTTP